MSILLINPWIPFGYRLTEQIYSGQKTLVYKGVKEKEQTPIIIKLMRNQYPTVHEIAKFRHQYTIIKDLDLHGIVKPLSLEHYHNRCALVMEDFGGISLQQEVTRWAEKNGRISAILTSKDTLPRWDINQDFLSYFFHIALQISFILHGLHRNRIIHKDIKPGNILINPITGEVKLIDFSIASQLPREVPYITNPNLLEGTLAYISPEQTGRMNRGVDYRSDFYSLGVTFFELLCGQLPFTTSDPMELVYCHIAKQPPTVSSLNPRIPTIVSEIVSKLMAKNAEDRYQSALGLKHDLEMCFQQWQQTSEIIPFPLGQKDISDNFLIPEKLYGRQAEIAALIAAFHRVAQGSREVFLVAGASGIGKTALVNEIHKPIVQYKSYFIRGKFDQFQRDIPLFGWIEAFKDLINQILSETDAQVQCWKEKILSALGENGQVLIDVIPKLEFIIGPQTPALELSRNEAHNRFNLLCQRFIHIFTSKEHPLVIFLDDLQWADTTSLKFMQLLLSKNTVVYKHPLHKIQDYAETAGGLLLIGAYRDNEVSVKHPLYLSIDETVKSGITTNNIVLKSLTHSDLNFLVNETLRCPEFVSNQLGKLIFLKTQGNPFYAKQFLKHLYREEIIKINFEMGHWQYDIVKAKALALTEDIVDFLAMQLRDLPSKTQEVLKIAACIGNQFDLNTLALVYQKSSLETTADLWAAIIENLIIPQTESYNLSINEDKVPKIYCNQELDKISSSNLDSINYKFIHDRVQQFIYNSIPEEKRQLLHLKIGQILSKELTVEQQEEKIFEVANQLNLARKVITSQVERYELIRMNLMIGRKAIAATAYAAALSYLTAGIELLADNSWETDYEMTLALYEMAAEVAYLHGDFEQTEQFCQIVIAQAKTLLDRVKVHEVKIQALTAQNQALKSINLALKFLRSLGIEFPENPSQSDIQLELEKIAAKLANYSMEDLLHLPKMNQAPILASMRILSHTIGPAYQAVPQLFSLICLKQIDLSLKYGNSSLSAFAYVNYGAILCALIGDIESGCQFGQLSASLLDKFNAKEMKAKIMNALNTVIRHWKEHLKEIIKQLPEVYTVGLETGNLEFAAYALSCYSSFLYFIGGDLTKLESQISIHSQILAQIKQENIFYWNLIYQQAVLNLLKTSEQPWLFTGEVYEEEKMVPIHQVAKDRVALLYLYFNKLFLCYLFQNYPQAVQNAIQAEMYLNGGLGQPIVPLFYFYDSLSRLAMYSQLNQDEQQLILERVQANQNKMQKWADHAPMNYTHKYYLVKAEQNRILSQYLEAIENYEYAIKLAKQNEYPHEEALANELAGKFYLEWNKQKIAQTYLTDAYYGYVNWGAKAKVHDLEKRYPQLLAPIFHQEQLRFSSDQSNAIERNIHLSTHSSLQTIISSNTSISDSLDLAAVIKASQALSSEIELEQLLSTLMQVVMENAGASKCALILSESDNSSLTVTAISYNSLSAPIQTKFPFTHLQLCTEVPITLIDYVKRTQEMIVIDGAMDMNTVARDPYIIQQQPKSLLCVPIINQGKMLGILYLENNLMTGAFTRDRVELLKLMTTQAAISLENALLYRNLTQVNEQLEEYNHTLEIKVVQRTKELNDKNQHLAKALEELQNTQTQLIQSEKMSSLGQMVAGIAHEINNPINFIHGNLTHAYQYVTDLLDLLTLYQQEYPYSSCQLQEKALEIDLDFLVEDLPKLLNSMKAGTLRIRNIVLGLRNFSRLDEAAMKPVDIHEGIDNTLMLLQHRLKARSDHPEIQVSKEYGQLPDVSCYTSHLNQVFMQILSNAIDALQQGVGDSEWRTTNGQLSPFLTPKIRICTSTLDSNTVRICIADNGPGMSQEVLQKVFDPFFTTKPVGSGVGLGLSISYQVVVEKHKGRLTCHSTPGQGTEFIIEIPIS